MDYSACTLGINVWEYPEPFKMYSLKGHPHGYLLNQAVWGSEQSYLALEDRGI